MYCLSHCYSIAWLHGTDYKITCVVCVCLWVCGCVCGCELLVNPCALSDLPYIDQRKVVSRLPSSLPLHIVAPFIDDDDDYWKRCCRSRWTAVDVEQYGGSWKRMMMEKTIESIIENYVPVPAQCARLQAIIPLAECIVRRLTIRQLLPPVRVVPDSDTGSYLVLSDADSSHFDFCQVLPQVSVHCSLPLRRLLLAALPRDARGIAIRYIHTYIEFRVNKCNALQTLYSSQLNGKETEKKCVLRLDLNAGKVVDEVKMGFELLHQH